MVKKPTLVLSPDGSWDANGRVEPTLTGGVRVVPSDRNEWVVTEATTNLHLEPVPQVPVTSVTPNWYQWSSAGSVRTNTIDTTFHPMFEKWWKHEVVTTLNGYTWNAFARTTGLSLTDTPITYSMYVATNRPRLQKFQLQTVINGVTTTTDFTANIGLEPVRVSGTAVIPAGSTLTAAGFGWFGFSGNYGLQDGDVYWFSGAQLETKSYTTPYVDGDMANGAWTGTPHASTSTRQYSRVAVGKQINAWQVAASTRNFVKNPRGKSTGTVWNSDPIMGRSYVQLPEPVNIEGVEIDTALKGQFSESGIRSGAIYQGITFESVTQHTASAWVYLSPNWSSGELRFRATGGAGVEASALTSGGRGSWQKISIGPFTPTAELSGAVFIEAYLATVVQGDWFYATAIQVEPNFSHTPYVDGDAGNGQWLGTPHASTSTRTASTVSTTAAEAAVIPWMKGSVLLRSNLVNDAGSFMTIGYPFGTANHIDVRSYDGGYYQLYAGTNNVLHYIPPVGIPLDGGPRTLYAEWDGEDIAISIDGGPKMYGTRVTPVDEPWVTWGLRVNGQRWHEAEAVLAFDTPLTDAEIAEYMAIADWQVLNPYAGNARIPYRSSMLTFEREVFIADGNNNIIEDITPLVRSVITDIDAARADSKVEANIETYTDPIADGDWVSIYHTLTPEQGDIVRRQRCLVRVETPRIQYTGGGEEIGMSTGRDIIRDMAMATLDIPFYTPVGGYVMGDVELAIRMLGITSMGPNLLTNGGFEDGMNGWSTPIFELGATGQIETSIPQHGGAIPDGKALYAVYTGASNPLGARVYTRQSVTIPSGAQKIYLSAEGWVFGAQDRIEARVAFTNSGGTVLSSQSLFWDYPTVSSYNQRWERKLIVLGVPTGTVSAWVYLFVHRAVAGAASARSAFDDVRFGACTGELLPASMIAMPPSTALATSRIQNSIGDPIFEIVEDRLKAIGIHSPYTTPDGRPTSRPILASEQDTATRSYDVDDARIADTVRIDASPSERANKVIAIKEVHDEPPLVATVYNRNPDDPYSLENYPPRGVRISMYDAIDVDALRAAALDELSRRVVRDEISFKIMPDPDINIHDVIEVTGPPSDRRVGRWIIIAIRDGSSGSNPAMEILARRVSLGEWS